MFLNVMVCFVKWQCRDKKWVMKTIVKLRRSCSVKKHLVDIIEAKVKGGS